MDAEPVPSEEGEGEGGAKGGRWRGVLSRRLPCLRWAARYDRESALADAVAGATLGLTLVPQSIAYAALAGLPVHYGLYSAFVGTMLYAALGTVKEVSIGPTSLMALLTLHSCRALPADCVVLLTFLSGCVVLAMGLLRLGFLVDFISPSVASGFTSATAVLIVTAQLKGLLGLSFMAETLMENARLLLQHGSSARAPDCLLGAACCLALLLLRKLKDLPVSPKRPRLRKALWLTSIARNAIVVLAASTLAYCTYDPHQPLFKLSGRVEPGLPRVSLPPFSTTIGNRTVGFSEMSEQLGSALLVLPLVMVLANIAIAKAFSTGGRVDATQEMLTLGAVNVVGSLVRAMPTCGAFTRSAVSHASGVRSPAAGLYSGVITLLALNYLTEYFFFIPKACLSAVLICAVIFMIDVKIIVRLWRTERREACVVLATWAAGVAWSVEAAVLAGALAALGALLRAVLRPARLLRLEDKVGERTHVVVQLRRALVYVNAEREAARVRGAGGGAALLDCARLVLLDHTAIQVLGRLIKEMKNEGRQLIFYNANPEVLKTLHRIEGIDTSTLHVTSARAALRAATDTTATVTATETDTPTAPEAATPTVTVSFTPDTAPDAPESLALLDRNNVAHEEV